MLAKHACAGSTVPPLCRSIAASRLGTGRKRYHRASSQTRTPPIQREPQNGLFCPGKSTRYAHSHSSSHSGVPGPGDNNFGNTSNTGYVITPSRAYAIDRASNGTYRARIFSRGGLSDSERGELVGNMQNWESGNSSESSKTTQQRFCQ